MKESTVLRDMASYFRVYGFDVRAGFKYGPRCFLGAHISVGLTAPFPPTLIDLVCGGQMFDSRNGLYVDTLEQNGWTTPDAVAVCEMAADICMAEGR